jgi:hypothetical protein
MSERIQVPAHMLQGLLGGPQPAQKPPDVVEVMTAQGKRVAFNADAIEVVWEETLDGCALKLKGVDEFVGITMSYDKFLKAIDVKPRVLTDGQEDPGD